MPLESYCSVRDAQTQVLQLAEICHKLKDQRGTNLQMFVAKSKDLLTLCNSLSVVYLQYGKQEEAQSLLHIATEAETALYRQCGSLSSIWVESVLLCNLWAVSFYKSENYAQALKHLFEAHKLIIAKKEQAESPELELMSQLQAFVLLWKIKNYEEARVYLKQAAHLIMGLHSKGDSSVLKETQLQNLYGLVMTGRAGLLIVLENQQLKATELCRRALVHLDPCRGAGKLVADLILKLEGITKGMSHWVVTPEFYRLLFASLFPGWIAEWTPKIHESELVKAKAKSVDATPRFPRLQEPTFQFLSNFPSTRRKRGKAFVSPTLPASQLPSQTQKLNISLKRPAKSRRVAEALKNITVLPVFQCIHDDKMLNINT